MDMSCRHLGHFPLSCIAVQGAVPKLGSVTYASGMNLAVRSAQLGEELATSQGHLAHLHSTK